MLCNRRCVKCNAVPRGFRITKCYPVAVRSMTRHGWGGFEGRGGGGCQFRVVFVSSDRCQMPPPQKTLTTIGGGGGG